MAANKLFQVSSHTRQILLLKIRASALQCLSRRVGHVGNWSAIWSLFADGLCYVGHFLADGCRRGISFISSLRANLLRLVFGVACYLLCFVFGITCGLLNLIDRIGSRLLSLVNSGMGLIRSLVNTALGIAICDRWSIGIVCHVSSP